MQILVITSIPTSECLFEFIIKFYFYCNWDKFKENV